ncbi:hypothetical protein PG989_012537 [Apiospora arundinis]
MFTTANSTTTMEPTEKCGNPYCRLGDNVGTEKLMRCSGCHVTTYCSHACQKTHWRAHKFYCKHVATNGGTSEHLGHVEYHGHVASQDPSARALMRRIGIPCSGIGHGEGHDVGYVLCRLIVTGQDTPENLELFFGKASKTGWVKDNQALFRLEALIGPVPGSLRHCIDTAMGYHDGCPGWTPRPASAIETWQLQEIRDLQHALSHGKIPSDLEDFRLFMLERYGNERLEEGEMLAHVASGTMRSECSGCET